MRNSLIRISAIVLLLLNGIAAVFGGYTLVIDPSGKTMQVSLDFLKHSPFPDYLIPGLLLLMVLGGGSLFAAFVAIVKFRWYPMAVACMGCVLIVWIILQILVLQVLFVLQFVIVSIGVVLLVLGVIQQRSLVPNTQP